MNLRRSDQELGERRNSIANVGTTRDVCIEKLTEQRAAGETLSSRKISVFLRAFHRSSLSIESRQAVGRQGTATGRQGILRIGNSPVVGAENALNVARALESNGVAGLDHVRCTLSGDRSIQKVVSSRARKLEALANDPVDSFGDSLVGTCDGKIVHLS